MSSRTGGEEEVDDSGFGGDDEGWEEEAEAGEDAREAEDEAALSPREVRRRAELREQERILLERFAQDAAATRCAATVVLRDKGTRMNCELWCAGGVVVRHSHCSRPCLLTTSAAIPDSYNAGHATVYFAPAEDGGAGTSSSSELFTAKLAYEDFMVVCNGRPDPLTDEFPADERASAKLADYCLVALDVDELPAHVRPVVLTGVRSKPLKVEGSTPVEHGDPLWIVEAPRSPSGTWMRVPGKAMEVEPKSLVFAPDPTADCVLRNGSPVFQRNGDGNLVLVGLHHGHRVECDEEAAEEAKTGIHYLSHGKWRHTAARLEPALRHLNAAAVVLARLADEAKMTMDTFLGSVNARREAIQASLLRLDQVLSDPSRVPPEIQNPGEAHLLCVQAEARGFEAVLLLLRVYKDETVQRFALEALARLLVDGQRCSSRDVTASGACELITLALQRYAFNADVVAAAAWNASLIAEQAESNRRFLQCDCGSALVAALRLSSEHGTFHSGAQRWGLSAMSVLARNTRNKQSMINEGVCDIVPGLLSNHNDVINDLELQIWGLHCILELCNKAVDTAGEAMIDAGLMSSLRKVRKQSVGEEPRWRELVSFVFSELDWEEY